MSFNKKIVLKRDFNTFSRNKSKDDGRLNGD